MAQRGFFGSLLMVFLIASLIFFIIYFFMPELSVKVLGASFKTPSGIIHTDMINRITGLELSGEEAGKIVEVLNTPEIRKLLSSGEARALINKVDWNAVMDKETFVNMKENVDISSFVNNIQDLSEEQMELLSSLVDKLRDRISN